MEKRVEHRLVFSKITESPQRILYRCSALFGASDYSKSLASLLTVLSNTYSDGFFEELNNALLGKEYEEYFSFDFESDSLAIQPPYIVYSDSSGIEIKIQLTEFMPLLTEWISFIKSGKTSS
jgi:hypothetical protein